LPSQKSKEFLKPEGKIITADYVIEKEGAMTECHKFSFPTIKELFHQAGFNLSEKRLLEQDLAFIVAVK